MEIRLDDDQRRAVYADSSAVVSAGAGSGKTTVLSQRFVQLVTSGKAAVDEILTLTFTRKAAAEMYERIYRRLREEAPEAAKAYDQASISTLDSFCARIVRDRSDRFGITRDFVQDNKRAEELARSSALDVMLKNRGSQAMDAYIDMFGFEGVLEKLFVALGTGFFTLADRGGAAESLELQHARLESEITDLSSRAEELIGRILLLDPSAHKQITAVHGFFAEEGSPDSCLNSDLNLDLERLTAISAVIRKPKGNSKHPDTALYREYAVEWETLSKHLESALETMQAWPLFTEMGSIIEEFRLALDRGKRSSGIVTFRDVPAMAVRLLEEDPEFRRSWKENYRFIMIDEFQDNNDLQRKLLYLLAEDPERDEEGIPDAGALVPGKLFFVGDEKQSIYRFRGADVGVFKRLSREIAAAGGQAIDLPRNYRSEPALIDFFNRFFPGIFADAREDYEAGFQPLKSRDASEGVVPKIGFFYRAYNPLKDESLLSDAESEAWYIARRIKEMVEGGTLPLPGGGTASYGDIALLMRSSSNQINFESSFRRLGVPYTVQSARALFLEAPVSDFYQILQLALYPEDRLAYLALLRSPFAGLSDDVISRLMLKEREEHAEPFSSDPDDPLFDGEGERYRLAGEAWRMVCDCADREPLAEIVRRLWHSFGYRYAVLRNPDYHVYLEYYDYLYEFALRADRQGETLVTFLTFLRENLGKYEKIEEVEPPREESVGVRIMSIHKSKGLQFPVVFVAGCGTTGRREGEGESPFFADPELGISLAAPSTGRKSGKANFFYRRGQELEKEQEVAEMKRLLYVAATRAEFHLFFSGYHGRNNRSMDGLGRFSFLNWIGAGFGAGSGDWEEDPAFDGYMEIIPPIETAERERAAGGPEGRRSLEEAGRAYASAGTLDFDYPRSSFSPSSLGAGFGSGRAASAEAAAEGGELPVDRYLEGEERITAFGTLCHRMVEEGIKRGAADDDSIPLPPQFSSLSPAAAALVMDTARSFARLFLDSETGMRARHESAAGRQVTEVAFLYRTGKGRFIDGSIDLLLEGGDDEDALVFDFKSDRGMEPEHHLPQLAIYRQAAEELTGKRVRTFLWYLRRGEAVELDTASGELSEILDADALIEGRSAGGGAL